jgi:nitrate reductase NapD
MHEPAVISSLVVHVRPERFEAVRQSVPSIEGAEVHAHDAASRMVVVLETETEADLTARVDDILAIGGVVGVNLVYHHNESRPARAARASPRS